MPDLEDQLRAYGRQLEESGPGLTSGPSAEVPVLDDLTRRRKSAARSSWFLVAAATVALAATASLLIPAARPGGDDMTNKGTGLVLGICLFGATACSSGNAAGPTTTAAADPSGASAPATTSSVSGLPPLFDGPADIEPGTYSVDVLGPALQVTVPAGYARFPENNAIEGPQHAYLAFGSTTPQDTVYVWTDACNYIDKAAAIGPTIDDMVTALQAMKNMDTSEPRPIKVGDYSGVEVVVSFPADLDISTCYGGSTMLFGDNDVSGIPGPQEPGAAITMRLLDIDGTRAAINSGANTVLPADVQAELDAMAESIRFS